MLPGAAASAATAASKNLILNPGAEAGAGSTDGSTVPVPHWAVVSGGTFTAVQYGAAGGFPAKTDPGPTKRGANFFAGGPDSASAMAMQTDSLKAYKGIIASGANYTFKAWLGGYADQDDDATVQVAWYKSNGTLTGTVTLGPVTAADRDDQTGLLLQQTTGFIPAGSAKMVVTILMTRAEGDYNDGYADDLSFTVKAAG
jgi:hypothetical protein